MLDSGAMGGLLLIGEATLLGLASGPACVASCGPVILPSLLAERSGLKPTSFYLGLFLGSRLIGYMLFALAAAQLGHLATLSSSINLRVFGIVHLLLAFVLLGYARSVGHACANEMCSSQLVTIGVGRKRRVPGVALLGLLTGVSLCPPFVAAGVRAAELGSIPAALIFFLAFFFGTSAWFLPFVGFTCISRNEAVITVARMAMVLIALYYGIAGAAMLFGRTVHGI